MSEERDIRHEGEVIRAEARVDAPPERLWRAFTEPAHLSSWFVDRADGEPIPGTTMVWFWDEHGYELPLEVVEAVPGKRLVLRSEWGPETTLMEFTLEAEGGSTRVRMVHSGFTSRDGNYEGTASGWEMALTVLGQYAMLHFGERSLQRLLTRVGSWSREAVTPFYRTARGLARWLGEGEPAPEGGEVRIRLADGGVVSGRVLRQTARGETCMSWREMDGILELKQWEGEDGRRRVAVRLTAWGGSEQEIDGWARKVEGALDRLETALDGEIDAAPSVTREVEAPRSGRSVS